MALMLEITNSWVYGLRTENFIFQFFLAGSTQTFEPSALEKGITKLLISKSQLSVFLKKDS